MKPNQTRRLEALESVRGRLRERQRVIDELDVKPHIATVYHDLHDDIVRGEHEFINLPGGRGSGKSSFCALEIVAQIMKDLTGQSNALIVRKWAVTLRGSVFSQIDWAINTLGVADRWQHTFVPLQFVYKDTGQVIRLTGLDDPQKLKSIKPSKGYFRFLWIEEFSEIVGEVELRNLQQSVLRGGERFTVFRSFNPPVSAANWANQYITMPDDRAVTLLTTYKDIPVEWIGQAFVDEAERLREINPKAYENEYMGIACGSGGEVFPSLTAREITDDEIDGMGYIYCGVDWGFSVDPFCFVRAAFDRKRQTVYVIDEIYVRGVSNQQAAEMIKERGYQYEPENAAQYVSPFGFGVSRERQLITCDSAEPKSIADFRNAGLNARPCSKWPGSVQYGIRWLQSKYIVIDPKRCPNAWREFSRYEYMTTKDGELTSALPDKDNHAVDGLRYALDPLIRSFKESA